MAYHERQTMYCHKCNSTMTAKGDKFLCNSCHYSVPVVHEDMWDDVRDWVMGENNYKKETSMK